MIFIIFLKRHSQETKSKEKIANGIEGEDKYYNLVLNENVYKLTYDSGFGQKFLVSNVDGII